MNKLGTGAKIDLGRFSRRKIKDHRGLGRLMGQALQESADSGIAAGKSMVAHQSAVDGRAVDAVGYPGDNLGPERFHL